jgi:hypothetical protein
MQRLHTEEGGELILRHLKCIAELIQIDVKITGEGIDKRLDTEFGQEAE